MTSGSTSIRCRTFDHVRATLRRVSRSGHSHAESICACPIAYAVVADAEAGALKTSLSICLASCALPERSS